MNRTSTLALTLFWIGGLWLGIFSCAKKADPVPIPTAGFSYSSTGNGSFSFTDEAKNADTYTWDFGDASSPSIDRNPVHMFAKNGTYRVTQTVKNESGSNAISKDVFVSSFASPVAQFSVVQGVDGGITFTNTSLNADTYLWDFGDGTTSTDKVPSSKTYTKNGPVTISLTATGKGGTNKTTLNVDINTIKPIADFMWSETGGTVTFTNTSKNANTYTWDFGDGKTSSEVTPKYAYAKNGKYTVVLTATNQTNSVKTSKEISVAGLASLAFDGCAVLGVKTQVAVIAVTYDTQGRPLTIKDGLAQEFSITYKSMTQIDKITLKTSPFDVIHEYTYTNGAVTGIVKKSSSSGTILGNYAISYTNGEMTKINYTPTQTNQSYTVNMSYGANRNVSKVTIVSLGKETVQRQYTAFDDKVNVYARGDIFRDLFPVVNTYYEFLCTNNPTAGKYPYSGDELKDFTIQYKEYNAKNQPTISVLSDGPSSSVTNTMTYDCSK
ncbi:PKD domain-containing protein [Spirosoma foliorum]|uniref:PKD domain-containing protein n=1 Tax=Spirosoma foliorum TaxID=2710596 RepID=A0A7G5GWT9_9BACT|nr:PKD domain-containing protein [Spirosoma foliorum]QMW03331.1 PKD domain-containing protein [Spirosoma foliorum]